MLLIKAILDPKFGMFVNYEETNMIWFNDYSFEDLTMYYLIGKNHFLFVFYVQRIVIYLFIFIKV